MMTSLPSYLLLLAVVGLVLGQLSHGLPTNSNQASAIVSRRALLAAPAAIKLTSSSCPALIKQGQVSGCVTRLQQLLNKWGTQLYVDGDFGPLTYTAVTNYQQAQMLDIDGIVGPQTKNSLESLYGATTNPTPTPVIIPPSSIANDIVDYAKQVAAGQAVQFWDGGKVPYSWGGGHRRTVGPSTGTCSGYTGPKPCNATQTVGVDCSGFARWVYYMAYGRDVLGNGNTNAQRAKMKKGTMPLPGDLVFYGTQSSVHHVAVYIGNGYMINALKTRTVVKKDTVLAAGKDVEGYYRL